MIKNYCNKKDTKNNSNQNDKQACRCHENSTLMFLRSVSEFGEICRCNKIC